MLPHPDTVCVLAAMDRRQVLAVAAQERRADESIVVGDRCTGPSGRITRVRGALLGLVGRRGGLQPAGPASVTAPVLP